MASGGKMPAGSPYAAVLWYLSAELGQQVDVLNLSREVGEDYFFICENMIPFRLKYLQIAADCSTVMINSPPADESE
jgi:hypothetical protein